MTSSKALQGRTFIEFEIDQIKICLYFYKCEFTKCYALGKIQRLPVAGTVEEDVRLCSVDILGSDVSRLVPFVNNAGLSTKNLEILTGASLTTSKLPNAPAAPTFESVPAEGWFLVTSIVSGGPSGASLMAGAWRKSSPPWAWPVD